MRFIDPHIHMSSRTTDDYERMKAAGIVAVIEPAFWFGQPRTNVGSYVDYLSKGVADLKDYTTICASAPPGWSNAT